MKPSIENVVAIIFGRGGKDGSQNIPRKNLLPVLGRPLMTYPFLAAKYSRFVVKTFFSTDDNEMAELGTSYGAEIIERPSELATRDALMEDTIFHATEEVLKRLVTRPAFLVIMMCNAPCILSSTIDDGVSFLSKHANLDSVITASRYNMFHPMRARRLEANGILQPYLTLGDEKSKEYSSNRDSAGDIYFGDSGMTLVRPNVIRSMSQNPLPFRWQGEKIGIIEQAPGGADLDHMWQLPVLEYWLRQHGFSETVTPYDRIYAGVRNE